MTRLTAWVGVAITVWSCCAVARDADAERRVVEHWRSERVAELTGEDGWLTLVGLFWLDDGAQSFGRAASNRLVLDHPALAPVAGSFVVDASGVRFRAQPGAAVTANGEPVAEIRMVPDTRGDPTVLSSGSLRFFVIERAGKLGVRVRDVHSPRRLHFVPIEYFPVDPGWALNARFESYAPHRKIRIVNILGQEVEMDSPGAIVFRRDGRNFRLDTILEAPADQTLFVMFVDRTSGKETYGGGRFLRVPLPVRVPGIAGEFTQVDFNESYNPPCAFNDFATCPLPPYQNHLTLGVDAGEKTYRNGHDRP
ncbi:MAG TPA: DUF1684 domain-containing protein [Steroidobacteraceae bacterium]